MKNLETSELASMYTEATNQLNGLEDATYLSTFLESIGDEPQCLRTTHNSMCQYWDGGMAYPRHSSSTPYQWRELYAAWRLAIPSRGWQALLAFPKKGKPYIRLMDYENWMRRLKKNSPSTASTMCFYANGYFQRFELDTLLQNLDS